MFKLMFPPVAALSELTEPDDDTKQGVESFCVSWEAAEHHVHTFVAGDDPRDIPTEAMSTLAAGRWCSTSHTCGAVHWISQNKTTHNKAEHTEWTPGRGLRGVRVGAG